VRAEEETTYGRADVETISEEGFKKLCEEIYRDRSQIYGFNPGMAKDEALLWVLTGCLVSLLSLTGTELESLSRGSSYGDEICALLEGRTEPPFDARPYIDELRGRAEGRFKT
jgi:hypothetical protein